MGGVDLCDMLISLYRTNIKTKRWYIKILFHCADISKVNAWNLYRRHCIQLRKPKTANRNRLFCSLALELWKGLQELGILSELLEDHQNVNQMSQLPLQKEKNQYLYLSVTFADGVHHWPKFREKKLNCRLCKTGNS